MLNGLDLCSGIGLLADAISPWVKPVAYCEIELYPRRVLIDRMLSGDLALAPVWNDITTLSADLLPVPVDLISAGFPCQDISAAGNGAGLAGKRSGLFFEVARLVGEFRPSFVFLENVPAIRTRGADVVAGRLAGLGYDCRWGVLSAFDVGAPHKRERWFLLAYRNCDRRKEQSQRNGEGSESKWTQRHNVNGFCNSMADAEDHGTGRGVKQPKGGERTRHVADTDVTRLEIGRGERGDAETQQPAVERSRDVEHAKSLRRDQSRPQYEIRSGRNAATSPSWWAAEPNVDRVAHGVPYRVERIKALGNGVVRQCAREAFMRLIGISDNS